MSSQAGTDSAAPLCLGLSSLGPTSHNVPHSGASQPAMLCAIFSAPGQEDHLLYMQDVVLQGIPSSHLSLLCLAVCIPKKRGSQAVLLSSLRAPSHDAEGRWTI